MKKTKMEKGEKMRESRWQRVSRDGRSAYAIQFLVNKKEDGKKAERDDLMLQSRALKILNRPVRVHMNDCYLYVHINSNVCFFSTLLLVDKTRETFYGVLSNNVFFLSTPSQLQPKKNKKKKMRKW